MSGSSQKQHRDKRWQYKNDLAIAQKDGSRSSGTIFSISKSGIFFRCEIDVNIGEVVNIGWKDQDVGVIKGTFNIRAKAKSTNSEGFDYRARYYKVDDQSKKNLLSLLKNLQSLKSSSGSLGIDGIKKIIIADTNIFSEYRAGKTSNTPAIHALIKEIPEIAIQRCLQPKTPFDHGLRKMQACHIQLSTVYAFMVNAQSFTKEDLSYCLNMTKTLLENYLQLENEDHTAIKATDQDSEEGEGEILNEQDLAKQQEIEAEQKKLIYIFKSLSNSIFSVAKNLVTDLKDHTWVPKVIGRSDKVLQNLNNQAKIVVDYFYSDIDVSNEHISDMDMILTRSAYEVEHTSQKSLEEDDIRKKPRGHKEAIRAFISKVILTLLVAVFFFLLWKENSKDNVKHLYKDEFEFNALKITKIEKRSKNLVIFVKSDSGENLNMDSAEILSATPIVKEFMEKHIDIMAIMIFDSRTDELVAAVPRFVD